MGRIFRHRVQLLFVRYEIMKKKLRSFRYDTLWVLYSIKDLIKNPHYSLRDFVADYTVHIRNKRIYKI